MPCSPLLQRVIGDDWLITLTLSDGNGNPLNLSLYAVMGRFIPPSSGAAPSDVSSTTTTVDAALGQIQVVVPRTITSAITPLPAGRKGNIARLQMMTVETATSLKITRAILAIEAIDPASFDPGPPSGDEPNYVRPELFSFGPYL